MISFYVAIHGGALAISVAIGDDMNIRKVYGTGDFIRVPINV